MRIGIMGGTLDPVHNGHLTIAESVMKACALDGVLLLPAGDPPHKTRKTGKWDRLEMAKLAAETLPYMTVSDIEVRREGTTYTVDTLRQLKRQQPETDWLYIIGADTVRVLDSWKNFREVARLCSFIAVGRPGRTAAQMQEDAARLEREYGARILLSDAMGPDISSTDVRDRVAQGLDISALVPAKVAAYIRKKGLYLCGMTWEEITKSLSDRLTPGRMRHTMGVAETAQKLAAIYGVDPQRARLAGLLHDCAKSMEYEEMVRMVREGVPDADQDEIQMEPVLHAPAGMLVAQREYGVNDPEILRAIRNHTLGGRNMSALEKLIYVADFIEPGRKFFDGLEDVRALALRDLDAAVRLSTQLSQDFVVSRGGKPHPRTMKMLKEI